MTTQGVGSFFTPRWQAPRHPAHLGGPDAAVRPRPRKARSDGAPCCSRLPICLDIDSSGRTGWTENVDGPAILERQPAMGDIPGKQEGIARTQFEALALPIGQFDIELQVAFEQDDNLLWL